MSKRIKIILADDHNLIRVGYKKFLNEKDHYEVIAEAENGKQLLDVLKISSPDIILLDLDMPVMNGREALEQITILYPSIKIIMLSSYYDEGFVTEYLKRGVHGYLSKNCTVEQMFDAIDQVYQEGYHLDGAISKYLLSSMLRGSEQKKIIENLNLSDIEILILKEICDEKTSQEIASSLSMNIHTVNNHRKNIQAKTQKGSVVGLVKFAIRNGIAKL